MQPSGGSGTSERFGGNQWIVVTGAKGFLGRATLSTLQAQGLPCRGVDRSRTETALDDVLSSLPQAERSRAVLIHLAGLADAQLAQREPVAAVREIVGLVHHTVEACVRWELAKCVLVSSAVVYGCQDSQPVSEEALLNPRGIYAGAKATAEMMARNCVAGHRIALEIVRPGNVIGPGMRPGTIIREILAQLRKGEGDQIVLRSMSTRRDYIHVLDVATALIAIARLPAVPGHTRIFNVGTGVGTSAQELSQSLAEAMGKPNVQPAQRGSFDLRAFDLVLNSNALTQATGWQPRVPLQTALRELAHDAA